MTWKCVLNDGKPKDDGEYLIAYRGQHTTKWHIMTAECENEQFDCDHSPPYVEYWMEIPPLPEPGRR